MLEELVRKNRSYRRFHEDESLEREVLLELVSLARLTPSAANKQALRYAVSADKERNERIFKELHWAAYLTDWKGPVQGERPAGYIILAQRASEKSASPYDAGIAAQTILLGAVEKGLGGCILASVNRENIKAALDLSQEVEILLVIALGKPKERVVIEQMDSGSNAIKYYRDDWQVHHVPKRRLEDVLL